MSKFYNPKIQKVSVIVEGKPNQLYAQGMRSFEQYDEICKYFAEGKQRDNDANEIQKHLQLYDSSLGDYLVNKYALWLDFRTIDDTRYTEQVKEYKMHQKALPYKLRKKKNQLGLSMLTFTLSWMLS